MGTDLHQVLRSLCRNSEWKYAVFWKLKHRARMVLTWEDGYYDNCGKNDPSEHKFFRKTVETLHGGHCSHEPLGLAVAKMSYHVYSLGEGVVGEVAVTGKHQWINTEKLATTSSLSLEYYDEWQAQFSAGINTILVIAVVPHGVVQLGSLNKVTEDLKQVTHIRDVFFTLQEFSVGCIPNQIISSTSSSLCVPYVAAEDMVPEGKDGEVSKHGRSELSTLGGDKSTKLLDSELDVVDLDHLKPLAMRLPDHVKSVRETRHCKSMNMGWEQDVNTQLSRPAMDVTGTYSSILPTERIGEDIAYLPPESVDATVCYGVKLASDLFRTEVSQTQTVELPKAQNVLEKSEFQNETSDISSSTSLKFPAGFELHEALGPAFLKKFNSSKWKADNTEDGTTLEVPVGMNSSQLTSVSHLEHLLEAVVANVCHSGSDVQSEQSICKSAQSLLTTETNPEFSNPAAQIVHLAAYSIDQPHYVGEDMQCCLSSSGVSLVMSPKGLSSTGLSAGSEHLERSSEPAKNNKKRARPGENCRPRPRDRQLIQDRIKELRELVPNGAKCSIDSLLERTVKHMLFLQGITMHADKLSKCANMKLCRAETGMLDSSSNEPGSTWAVEVGGHLKVCSIIVENLNKSGQILVEMLCEECSHFLEIAEAIKSLGLTILKGVTESHGEKIWICFIVEGENNRSIQRMDILWSLVQILQPREV